MKCQCRTNISPFFILKLCICSPTISKVEPWLISCRLQPPIKYYTECLPWKRLAFPHNSSKALSSCLHLNISTNPFIHNLCTLPCLLWFQYPAALWPHAALLNLVLPEKMHKKYYISCADMGDGKKKNEVKNNKVIHFITFFHCMEKVMIYIWILLLFTFCSIVNSSWHCSE